MLVTGASSWCTSLGGVASPASVAAASLAAADADAFFLAAVRFFAGAFFLVAAFFFFVAFFLRGRFLAGPLAARSQMSATASSRVTAAGSVPRGMVAFVVPSVA